MPRSRSRSRSSSSSSSSPSRSRSREKKQNRCNLTHRLCWIPILGVATYIQGKTALMFACLARPRSRSAGKGKENKTLHVKNLTRNVSDKHLEEIFGIYGKVDKVELAVDGKVLRYFITNRLPLLSSPHRMPVTSFLLRPNSEMTTNT